MQGTPIMDGDCLCLHSQNNFRIQGLVRKEVVYLTQDPLLKP
jgi:hypothetical protein